MTKAAELAKIISGGAVFNEDSADVDFRVESNNNANMLVVNGGSNLVGIGDDPDLGEGLHIKNGDSGASANSSSDNLVIESSGTAGINILTGSGGNAVIDFGDSADNNIGRIIYNHTNNALQFHTNASEAMRIFNNGNVTIGTTNELPGINNTSAGMSLRGASTANSIMVSRDSGISGYFNRNDNGSVLSFRRSGTEEGNISVTTTSASFISVSDYRLKENVTYDFDATTRLKQLKPARFNFIVDADTTVDGFLAHEVQSVVPQAITGEKDAVDDDGNPVYQGIDQSKLVPLLVKTIQELEARITALEEAN